MTHGYVGICLDKPDNFVYVAEAHHDGYLDGLGYFLYDVCIANVKNLPLKDRANKGYKITNPEEFRHYVMKDDCPWGNPGWDWFERNVEDVDDEDEIPANDYPWNYDEETKTWYGETIETAIKNDYGYRVTFFSDGSTPKVEHYSEEKGCWEDSSIW